MIAIDGQKRFEDARQRFESVLASELLDDLAIFAKPDFFDEVPLYSRFSQVEFLESYGDVDSILIELALAYLQRVADAVRLRSRRFVAMTVTDCPDDEFLTPSIFVCNTSAREKLSTLQLQEPSAPFTRRIEQLVKQTKSGAGFQVMEDRSLNSEEVRVFVGFESPPRGILRLDFRIGRQQTPRTGQT